MTRLLSEPDVDQTIALVCSLHEGQTDFGGRPYIEHLLGVLACLPPDASDVQKKAALLHDTIEDVVLFRGTPQKRRFTADDLRALGYGEDVVAIVQIVTKEDVPKPDYGHLCREEREARSEDDYVESIRRKVVGSGNVDAMQVKRADNLHNSDPSRDKWLTTPAQLARTARLRRRYRRSIAVLDEAIELAQAQALSSMH
jgi:(p)ppGpp synthase/HD superfamily hydrolase